jgi:PEGA domain
MPFRGVGAGRPAAQRPGAASTSTREPNASVALSSPPPALSPSPAWAVRPSFKGCNEKAFFSTEPENTSVYVNGMYSGKGAFQQNLASNGTYAVECRRPGYEARSQTFNHSVGAGWIILDVLGGSFR